MPRFYNQYSPQTDIGSGLNNAIGALFAGKGPRDQALDAAHMEAYRATAAKSNAEARSEEASLAGRQNFLEDSLRLLGPVRESGARSYLNTGEAPREAITSETEMGPLGVQNAGWFTPRARRDLDATAQLASLLMAAEGSDIEKLAKARTALAGGVEEAGVLEGSVDPTRFMQSRGKPTSSVDEGYAVNMADPSVAPRELGIATALIGERNAEAGKHTAAATLDTEKIKTEKSRQKELGARAANAGKATKLVPVMDEDGSMIWVPAGEAAGQKVGGKNQTKKPLTKSQNEQMAAAVAAQEAELDAALDADTKARVTSRATQLAADPASEFYQDPSGAVQAAFDEVGELDVSGEWNPFKSNVATAKNKPGAKPAAAAPAAKAPARGGKNDQQLLDEANAAIKKGANRDAVMKRLKDMGVKVN